ncbi:ribosomal protein 60S [Methanolacinia petrolearia DSM 11571]|uniref:Large ribosomal subunit protein P1 n=1 Tax=Methanolacinia petrolearia (strain DSM 11571 / OCM 486 / SEBR 4847) TaxID=679926 RepID=E1RJY9_METP4|nr:50S ribosomal protein P1 [Methanolacinia petrolearia]ADN36873.1 ribosomal protein 60S [Methanolacinia petrolearia DSM 11571]
MEYIYAALILHSAGKEINEEAVSAVLTAAGIAVDDSRVKALIAALDGVDIAEAIEKSAVAAVAAAPAAAAPAAEAAPAQEEAAEEEEKADEEGGMAGLGALFG